MSPWIGTRTRVLVLVGVAMACHLVIVYISFDTIFISAKEPQEPLQEKMQQTPVKDNRPMDNENDTTNTEFQSSGLSVIISVYRQPKCLQQMVQYFRLCPIVQEIRVNWFQNTSLLLNIPKGYFSVNQSTIPVHFDVLPNNISHRFSPHRSPPLVSNATFHVDVDTFYSCRALEFAYNTWVNQFNASQQTVVGFHPRFLKSKGRFYRVTASYQKPFRHNTIFVTKGGLLHQDLLHLYFQPNYQSWRDLVDSHVTAEDMLMSFVLAVNNVSTVALCIEPEDTCSLVCAQGKQVALAISTASMRPQILDQLFDNFGTNQSVVLPKKKGPDSLVWLNDSTKDWRCYSAPSSPASISVAKRKCQWFCDHSPICPMNPARNDPADEW